MPGLKRILFCVLVLALAAGPSMAQEKGDDALQQMWGLESQPAAKPAPKPVEKPAPKPASPVAEEPKSQTPVPKVEEPKAPAPAPAKPTTPPPAPAKPADAPKAAVGAPKEEQRAAGQPAPAKSAGKSLVELLKSKGLISAEEAAAVEPDAKQKFAFSGEMRFRPEMKNNYDFNDKADDAKAYIGQRIRLNAKVNAGDNIEAYMTIQDSRRWGEKSASATNTMTAQPNNVSSGGEAESLDLYQAYFQVSAVGGSSFDFKIGRQMLVYGDQRLLGHLGWSDNARAFDAYKLVWHVTPAAQLDFFAATLSETGEPSGGQGGNLYGAYLTAPMGLVEKSTVDIYYLVWTDTNQKSVNTYGLRLAGKPGSFDFTGEAAWQGGKWSQTVDQSANAFAVTAGYTFKEAWNTRLGVEYDYGSGDDKSSTTAHKTFVFPFHTNHAQYGYMDLFSWGNMKDTKIMVTTNPLGAKTSLEIAYHTFQLDQAKDGWYNVVGTADSYPAAGAKTATDAGTEWDFTLTYPYSQSLKLLAGYSWFTPGDAVKERKSNQSPDNATWGFAMFLLSF